MIEIGEFVDARGRSPFGRWVSGLDGHATARVATALYRMEMGNLSNAKGVGGGVFEYRIDFGAGYRIYFGRDGDALIVLSAEERRRASSATSRLRWRCGASTGGASGRGLRLCH